MLFLIILQVGPKNLEYEMVQANFSVCKQGKYQTVLRLRKQEDLGCKNTYLSACFYHNVSQF